MPLCSYNLLWILDFSKEDMAKSLLHMISNDIGQLACLYAKLHNLSRVYFGGFFIRGHPVTMHTITYSINFFTKASKTLCSDTETTLQKAVVYLFHVSIAVNCTIFKPQPFDLLLLCCRVKFRPCFWGMKVIWEPLEPFLKEQRKTVRKKQLMPVVVFKQRWLHLTVLLWFRQQPDLVGLWQGSCSYLIISAAN